MCKSVTFENCTNTGNVTVTGHKAVELSVSNKGLIVSAGGFIGSANTSSENIKNKVIIDVDSTNTGTITAKNTATNKEKTVRGTETGVRDETAWVSVYPKVSEL